MCLCLLFFYGIKANSTWNARHHEDIGSWFSPKTVFPKSQKVRQDFDLLLSTCQVQHSLEQQELTWRNFIAWRGWSWCVDTGDFLHQAGGQKLHWAKSVENLSSPRTPPPLHPSQLGVPAGDCPTQPLWLLMIQTGFPPSIISAFYVNGPVLIQKWFTRLSFFATLKIRMYLIIK